LIPRIGSKNTILTPNRFGVIFGDIKLHNTSEFADNVYLLMHTILEGMEYDITFESIRSEVKEIPLIGMNRLIMGCFANEFEVLVTPVCLDPKLLQLFQRNSRPFQ